MLAFLAFGSSTCFFFPSLFLISLFILILSIWHRSHLCYQSFWILIYPQSFWFHCFIELVRPASFILTTIAPKFEFSLCTSQSFIVCFLVASQDACLNRRFVLLGAIALEKPIHHHNAGKNAIVWKTVTVYATYKHCSWKYFQRYSKQSHWKCQVRHHR